ASLVSFFFSSRRRHTRSKRDWSSDVCSSDLDENEGSADEGQTGDDIAAAFATPQSRSEHRFRVATYVLSVCLVILVGSNLYLSQIGRASCRERVGISAGRATGERTAWSIGAG